MITIAGLITFAGLLFWLWALIDALTTDRALVRLLPRAVWIVLLILFIGLAPLAALLWVVLGRPRPGVVPQGRGELRRRAGDADGHSSANNPGRFGDLGRTFGRAGPEPTNRAQRPPRPIGPDDDPDFLGRI